MRRRQPPAPGDDPWLAARLALVRDGRRLAFLAPRSGFSSGRIDDGTLLLLEHLPPGAPRSFLDLGCGYGAIGLALAASFPGARGLLADRDLLAVDFCRRNVALQGAAGVEVIESLGYRDLPPGSAPFDWILSNVPARAGERVLAHFIAEGRRLLAPGGELRIVAISPLSPAVARAAAAAGSPAVEVARTSRHAVHSFPPPADGAEGPAPGDPESVYERDVIEVSLPERLRLARPTDLADEPHRLETAIPLLADSLPCDARTVLAFRCGYGLVPALCLARWPAAAVVGVDRDLLATSYARRNCAAAGDRFRALESIDPAPLPGPFDLVVGELSPPVGETAILRELERARSVLAPGGRALVLGLLRMWEERIRSASRRIGASLAGSRGPIALIELRG